MKTRPASLLLIHGAGSGPWIFDGWYDSFPDLRVEAVDLQAGLDVARSSMSDFATALIRATRDVPEPAALCGWSMGGLVAMQAAAEVRPHSVVLLESSPPGETQGFDLHIEPAAGVFDPEEVYGPFPPGIRSRPESSLARADRKRGVSVPSLPCPSLVVVGHEFRRERGRPLADLYSSDLVELDELDHWGLVLDRRPREIVRQWLAGDGSQTPSRRRTLPM
jgi:pimeloyl-ACP methyl ester carboxylesterase